VILPMARSRCSPISDMNHRRRIDFNLDLGEGFGIWSRDNDEDTLITLATSVNLACGFHAGDPGRMRAAVAAAARLGVAVGAHPGLPDPIGFGRRHMMLSAQELKDCILYQVGALTAFTRAADVPLHHVKLHGALATQCNRDPAAATAYAEAVADIGASVPIYSDPSSEVWNAAERLSVPTVAEFYADMPLCRDGRRVAGHSPLSGRHESATPEYVRVRVRDLLRSGRIDAHDGGQVAVAADTISVHSDGPVAADMARAVILGVQDAECSLSADLP
jgi:UPF0271 protein